jgi:hypothetical protein
MAFARASHSVTEEPRESDRGRTAPKRSLNLWTASGPIKGGHHTQCDQGAVRMRCSSPRRIQSIFVTTAQFREQSLPHRVDSC